jgi:hypothetical protein
VGYRFAGGGRVEEAWAQFEALRWLEIPEDMQKKYGFKPLGPADGPVKSAIFGETNARLFYGTATSHAAPDPPPHFSAGIRDARLGRIEGPRRRACPP